MDTSICGWWDKSRLRSMIVQNRGWERMTDVNQLHEYHVWANGRVLQHLSELPDDVLYQELQSVFPSIGATLSHMYVADNLWLSAMSDHSLETIGAAIPRFGEEVKDAPLAVFQARFADVAARYRIFFESQADMDAYAEYPHPRHGVLRARYSEIVQHVVNHGTYHRGNITAMLRQMGHAGVATDYVLYLFTLTR